jgi:hypothetical protein
VFLPLFLASYKSLSTILKSVVKVLIVPALNKYAPILAESFKSCISVCQTLNSFTSDFKIGLI